MAKLEVKVPEDSKQNIETIVQINAPIEKVFEAYTDVDLITKWFMRGNDTVVHKFEATTGGSWHITEKSDDGAEYEFCGSYHEVAKNERIIWTFEFLGMPERGHVSLEKMDFIKVEDNTTDIRSVSTFQTAEDRDGMVSSGMEKGMKQGIDALGELLEK